MNRRNFLQSLLAFSILPSAQTYKRIWKATESGLVIPTYARAGFEYPVAFTISDIPDPSAEMMRFHEHVVRMIATDSSFLDFSALSASSC